VTTHRLASRLLFGAACLLLGGALVALATSIFLPYEGLQDLGRVVLAMLLASLAAILFILALLVGRGTQMPRWMTAASILGAIAGAVPAIALVAVRAALG
jgi:hypothetical protein